VSSTSRPSLVQTGRIREGEERALASPHDCL
jgi:hypothetical protein